MGQANLPHHALAAPAASEGRVCTAAGQDLSPAELSTAWRTGADRSAVPADGMSLASGPVLMSRFFTRLFQGFVRLTWTSAQVLGVCSVCECRFDRLIHPAFDRQHGMATVIASTLQRGRKKRPVV